MAAIYHYTQTQSGPSELFKAGIQVLTAVKIPFLERLLAPENLTVITEISMQNTETVQFFMTFDDVISWFYFGKGMGHMGIRGLLLTSENGTPGLSVLLQDVMKSARGQSVQVSLGNAVFRGVLTAFHLNLSQDPSPVVEFALSLNIVGHNLPTREKQNLPCDYNPRFDDVI